MAFSCSAVLRVSLLLVGVSVAGSGCITAVAAQNLPQQDAAQLQPTAAVPGAATNGVAKPTDFDRWYIRVGASGVFFHPGSSMSAAGTAIPGTSVSVSNRATATFDIGYYLTKNISASFLAGVPPKSTLSGQHTVAPYGNLGAVRYGPAVLAAQYHFHSLGALQPYVGAGATYLIIFKKHDAAVQDLMVHNSFSPIARAGADYMVGKRWGVYADWWQTWLVADAHGALEGTVPVKAHVRLYPTVVTTGLLYRF